MKEKMKALAGGIVGFGFAACWLVALGLLTTALPAAAWKFFVWAWGL